MGKYFQKRVKNRSDLYADVSRYIAELKLNVTGKQTEISKFNEEFLQRCSKAFSEFFSEQKSFALSTAGKKQLQKFFADLDCISGEQLLQHLNFYEKQFEVQVKDSVDELKKSSMYVKLGLLLGAMIGILFL